MKSIEKHNEKIEKMLARGRETLEIIETMPGLILPASTVEFCADRYLSITPYTSGKESGKMYGVPAIGTTCHVNDRCIERILAGYGVCRYCFSALGNVYPADVARLAHNYTLLQTILPDDVITRAANELIAIASKPHTYKGKVYPATMQARGEHKGDVGTAIHAYNYFRIGIAMHEINPYVSFTVWTKNPDLYADAIRIFNISDDDVKKLRIVYSAFDMNDDGIKEIERIKSVYPFLSAGFMVYEGGRPGANSEIDAINESIVKERFSEKTSYNVQACRCNFASCASCKACYTCKDFTIMCENVRL